jgi:type IV pilus assembly protein PilO
MRFGARELIFLVVMVALLACTYVFVFAKTNASRLARQHEIADKQRALFDLKQATAGIDDLNRKIGDLQKAIDYFDSKLPQEKEFDSILKEVSEMAEHNSLQTKTVRTLKAERGPLYSEQPIQMTLSGDFSNFYQFLIEMEKLPRITRITQMNLQKINDRDGAMQAAITLSIFFEPDTGPARVAGAE